MVSSNFIVLIFSVVRKLYSDGLSKYFLRVRVNDQPGVLSKITSYFNDNNISIEKILQIPDNDSKSMPIVITTHKIKSSELLSSVKKIADPEFILDKISLIPIEY